jgi:hypothetical protein
MGLRTHFISITWNVPCPILDLSCGMFSYPLSACFPVGLLVHVGYAYKFLSFVFLIYKSINIAVLWRRWNFAWGDHKHTLAVINKETNEICMYLTMVRYIALNCSCWLRPSPRCYKITIFGKFWFRHQVKGQKTPCVQLSSSWASLKPGQQQPWSVRFMTCHTTSRQSPRE